MRLSVQVLDGTYGQSAAGVRTSLERSAGKGWTAVADAETASTGCIEEATGDWRVERGLYRIVFDSDGYFAGLGAVTAYPAVVVVFKVQDEYDSCHVTVMLSPHWYSAYIGIMNGHPLNTG